MSFKNWYDLLETNSPERVASWSCEQDPTTRDDICLFNFSQLALELGLSANHQHLTSCQVKDLQGRFPRRKLDALRKDVRQTIHDIFGASPMVKQFDLEVAILQALELMAEFEQEANPSANIGKGWSAGEI